MHAPAVHNRGFFLTSKKRRRIEYDMYTQRAYVARYEEPVFCPNHTSSTFTYESLLNACADVEHDHAKSADLEDPDEDMGGVPLPPTHHVQDEVIDVDAVLEAGTTIRNHETPLSHDANSSICSGSSAPRPQFLYGSDSHLAAESVETGEDVNVVEARSSLAGAALLPVLDLGRAMAHSSRHHDPAVVMHNESSDPLANRLAPPDTVVFPDDWGTSNFWNTTGQYESAAENTAPDVSTQEGLLGLSLDEDFIAVDDPRRHFDFADFMDLWRLRSIKDRRLPLFEPGIQPSVRFGRKHKEVTRKSLKSGEVDMQGLRWNLIGPTRGQAISARTMLNPSTVDDAHQPPQRKSKEPEQHHHFRSFLTGHKARINHYQLRNNLAASSRNEVFYATGDQIQRASLTLPEVSETAVDLSRPTEVAAGFRITCISASARHTGNAGVLFAGGFYGEFAMLELDATQQTPSQGFVTHAFNGLVTHVHNFADRRSGLLKATFCTNDSMLHVMDVQTLRFTDKFSYGHAVNCSATSPDGRLRVLAGDSQEVLITDAERGQTLITLRDQTDHGFACDWSVNGRYVATAAQDGKTLTWDARKWSQPVATIHSMMSCARSVQFADDGSLVIAENDDIVSIYRHGTFDTCQDIRFFGAIAGVALLDGGNEMIVANADKTVGGLLTFSRTSQGYDEGLYGYRSSARTRNYDRRKTRRWFDMSDVVPDILI